MKMKNGRCLYGDLGIVERQQQQRRVCRENSTYYEQQQQQQHLHCPLFVRCFPNTSFQFHHDIKFNV